MIIYGTSNIGKIRKDNQDSYMFYNFDSDNGYAVICDGMGGTSGGKTASSIAVSTFSSGLLPISDGCSSEKLNKIFKDAIDSANSQIYNKSISDGSLKGMGTTLVAVVIINGTGYFLNVGDSRAYVVHDGVIRRITHDHSAVQELVDNGLITENQARNHPNKNIITRALGVDKEVRYDCFKETLEKDDIIVLCSDGITNYVDDLEIPFEIASQQNIENVPYKLIELANSRGGSDNSTVVIVKI